MSLFSSSTSISNYFRHGTGKTLTHAGALEEPWSGGEPVAFSSGYASRSMPPLRPLIWIRAFVGTHRATAIDRCMFFDGKDHAGGSNAAEGYCSTLTVGHLAFQVFDVRTSKNLRVIKPFPADALERREQAVVPIWPPRDRSVIWQPPFVLDDAALSLLIDRWKRTG